MPSRQLDNSITVVRALCVVGIVVFHIDKNWLPLGYLGVDLFFVLSGFLITSIILKHHKEGVFSYTGFYKRRFLRLMPAFYASLLLTLLSAVLVSYHDVELIELIESSISSLLFSSNLYFWKNTGYFVATTNIIENIHHWSLSVEEQFYFIWPICLLLLSRFFRVSHWSFVVLVVLLGAASIYLSVQYPRPAFYLLPTRAWQFLIGALVAIHAGSILPKIHALNKSLFLLGIILVITLGDLIPEFDYKIHLYTVVISVFLAIFLMAGRSGSLLMILENRLVLWVGLASYSIYLAHQPVLAVSRKLLRHPDAQTATFVLIAIILITFFGAIVHKVENVFRYRMVNGWILTASHVVVLSGFLLLHYLLPKISINSEFADPAKFDYGCQTRTELGCEISIGSLEKDAKILLLGNSHARMLLPAFRDSRENLKVFHPDKLALLLLGGNDDIAIQLNTPEKSKTKWMQRICEMADDYDSVVMSYRYIGYLYQSSNVHLSERSLSKARLNQLNQRLQALAECVPHLIIISQVPELNFWPRNVYRGREQNGSGYLPRVLHEEASKPLKDMLLKIGKAHETVDLVFPEEFLCDEISCFSSQKKISSAEHVMYYDDDHLNIRGSRMVISAILKLAKE
jgi:peptidoglycan/LPS O-acetylase OafA/YrhL